MNPGNFRIFELSQENLNLDSSVCRASKSCLSTLCFSLAFSAFKETYPKPKDTQLLVNGKNSKPWDTNDLDENKFGTGKQLCLLKSESKLQGNQ